MRFYIYRQYNRHTQRRKEEFSYGISEKHKFNANLFMYNCVSSIVERP